MTSVERARRASGAPDPDLTRFLAAAVEEGRVSSTVALIGSARRIERWAAAGEIDRRNRIPCGRACRFDLASLTKPIVATLAVDLDESGLLRLATEVGEIWPDAAPRLAHRRLADLLRHRSGLAPWAPLWTLRRDARAVAQLLVSGRFVTAAGEAYSDLGYILWARAAERVLGEPLARLLRRRVAAPLRMSGLATTAAERSTGAACGVDGSREVELAAAMGLAVAQAPPPHRGRIQDRNARFLGPSAGHAGLFATAADVWALAAEWLRPVALLPEAAVAEALAGGRRFALGWWRRRSGGAWDASLSPEAFGHTGFTGGGVWVDPARERVMVLLAHRSSVAVDLDPWRRAFQRLALGG